MGKEIDSEALVLLRKGLGIGGIASPTTLLEEDSVIQVVEVGQFARQGLPAGNGLFYFVMRIITSVGNPSLDVSLFPYIPDDPSGASVASAPFPNPVPSTFDIWIMSAVLNVTTATFVDAALFLRPPPVSVGLSIENADTTTQPLIAPTPVFPLAAWDGVQTVDTFITGDLAGSDVFQRLGMRLPRGCSLNFRVDAGGINTATCTIAAALMPRSMGQDVAV